MTALGPLGHISRPPLPWRAAHLTECGKPLADIDPQRVLTREQVAARIRQVGKQRAAFSTCMTCATTSNRHPNVPVLVLHRELGPVAQFRHWAGYGFGVQPDEQERIQQEKARHDQFVAELRAITALVEAHRDEFDAYLADLQDTVNLADRRRHKNTRSQRLGGAS